MPVTLKKDSWKVKDDSTGTYRSAAILSTTLPADAAQVVEEAEAAIDAQETRAAGIVSDCAEDISDLEAQKNTIAATIASMADLGTDTTLSTPGMAADAASCGELKSALSVDIDNIDSVTYCTGKNLFDARQLLQADGCSFSSGVYSATAGNLAAEFPSTSNGLVIKGGFKENQRYTLSMKIKNTGSDTASGWGIGFYILYTNGTTRNVQVNKNVTTFETRTLTSEADKTISKIYITAQSAPTNTWELKEIQIEEGTSASTYEAFDLSAIDEQARSDISSINSALDNALYFGMDMPSATSGFIKYADGTISGSTGASYYIIRNIGYSKIWFYGYSTSTTLASIAFYNTDGISAGGYIKASSKQYSITSAPSWISADVPSTAKIIVLCGANPSETYTPAIKFLNKDLYPIIKNDEQKQINRLAYFMPYKNEKLIDHLFIGQVTSQLTENIIVPCQSVFHVAYSARLGFKYIECNTQATATPGKYIVTHGVSGTLGRDFQTTGGESAYGVVIGETSYSDLRSGYKYISQIPEYEVPPTSLEEFLYACKENKIVPMVQYRGTDMLEIVKGIMGNEFILYQGNHDVFDGLILTYHSYTTKAEIVNQCASIGAPYIYSMGNPSAFTDEELADIVNTVHKMGCLIACASAYDTIPTQQRCRELGSDFDGSNGPVNPFETGDVVTFNSFSDFTLTSDITISDGVMTMPSGSNLSSGEHSGGLIKWCCKIMFNGTLKIDNKIFTSDGTHVVYVSGFKVNTAHNLWIIAQANTTVTMLKYVVSKC